MDLATSTDGINFTDQGTVLDWSDSNVWGYGDELFPIGTFFAEDQWNTYYIAKGTAGSWVLGVGQGPSPDNLTTTTPVNAGRSQENAKIFPDARHGEGRMLLQ